VLAGVIAGVAIAAGVTAGSGTAARADPPDQRPLTAKSLLQSEDVQTVYPSYTSIKAEASTTPGDDRLSACTVDKDLSDVIGVEKTWYGTMQQDRDDDTLIKITQQAAHDGRTDGDAYRSFVTITAALDNCVAQMIDGLIYHAGIPVDSDAARHAVYYPQVDDDMNLLGATIVVTNQDHVNVLEVSSLHPITEKQLAKITKLAVVRLR